MENRGTYRRSGGTALYVTMAAAFIVIAAIVAMALFFKVSEITVEGASKYTPQQVIDASGIEMDDSIFFVSSGSAEIDIKNSLPYVDQVSVTRDLPGRVVIRISESVPVASVRSGGGWLLLDGACRIIDETADNQGTVELRGITPSEPEVGKSLDLGSGEDARLTSLKELMTAMADEGILDKVSWLDMSNLSSVTFDYNGYNVNFGRADDLERKFGLLEQFTAQFPETGYGQNVVYDEKQVALHYNP